MKLGVVRGGNVLARAIEPTSPQLGLLPQLPLLEATWLRLLGELELTPRDCSGIAVAFPSIVEPATARVLDEYGKYRDAPGLDLRAWARRRFDLPLAIENDARMACIGEWRSGAGRGVDNMVMITLGTGLGTAAVMEGRALRGRHGQAGILGGHTTVRYGGRACVCGNAGCAEAEASTECIAEMTRSNPEFPASKLAMEPTLDYSAVFRSAASGDPAARALRDHSLLVWGALAVNLIHSYDPELVILGGGIMASAEVILPAVRAHVERHAHTPWGKVRVVPSALGDAAALVAGEWLLREQFPALSP